MDGAGIDNPAFRNGVETPKRSGYIGLIAPFPDCCLSQPRPFWGFCVSGTRGAYHTVARSASLNKFRVGRVNPT